MLSSSFIGERPVALGWGSTHYGGEEVRRLRGVDLPVWSQADCNDAYFQVSNYYITASVLQKILYGQIVSMNRAIYVISLIFSQLRRYSCVLVIVQAAVMHVRETQEDHSYYTIPKLTAGFLWELFLLETGRQNKTFLSVTLCRVNVKSKTLE